MKVANIMQYCNHPVTNEVLLTEEQILLALSHSSVREYAYILHNEDVFSEEDELQDRELASKRFNTMSLEQINQFAEEEGLQAITENDDKAEMRAAYVAKKSWKKAGEKKPAHYHIVVRFSRNQEVDTIAAWFGIASNYIDIPRGRNSFLDCVEYLTHESEKQQQKGKHRYDDTEVHANFDFRHELTTKEERRLKYGRDLSLRDELRSKVLYDGMTLREAEEEYPLEAMNDMIALERCRARYLNAHSEMPALRINFYVEGSGGIGKNIASKSLAKALARDMGCTLEKPYFEVGGDKCSFEGYDGEPIIIWNDTRAIDLIIKFGRGETFDIFDLFPTDSRHNIKYGSIRLANCINIVNGIQSYREFLDGIAGEYVDKYGTRMNAEDKSQANRRFPIIFCLRSEDYDILLNKGVACGTREFEQYIGYLGLQGSFKRMAETLSGEAREVIEGKMCEPAIDCVHDIQTKMLDNKIESKAEIPDEFANYGSLKDNPFLVADEI